MRREEGNLSELLGTGICILAMTVLMVFYMESVELIQQKTTVSQLARRYILRMETVGFLTEQDEQILCRELTDVGVTEIDLSGSTRNQVAYGETITLHIGGRLKEKYEFEEQRMSTAKN